nr:type II toxin-antitoxin system PemK/MazF family toxin [Paeniclostridium sp.]
MKKGSIVEFFFENRNENSKVINGQHRVVVLHSRETPYKTILIAPITTLESLDSQNRVPANYLKLDVKNYPFILEHDSYLNLDMMMVVDSKDLEAFERCGKKINATLNDDDLDNLDLKIAMTYELQNFVKKEEDRAVKEEVENIIEYMDTEIREKFDKIISLLKDEETINLLKEVLDVDLIGALRGYC